MASQHFRSFDIRARARQAMTDAGFEASFPPDAVDQLQEIEQEPSPAHPAPALRDLRSRLWSSIDNDDSRDLDQVEVAESQADGSIRVFIGIADVDSRVSENSPIDRHAGANTTSVYTGVVTFPMLPEPLSTDLTSLNEEADRLAVVIEMVIDAGGSVTSSDIYRALLRNKSKLAYDAVGDWLEGQGPMPAGIANVPGLEAQIRLQDEAAQRLHKQRQKQGFLDFETIEARPVMEADRIVGLDVPRKNRARTIIEDFMIAANTTIGAFFKTTGQPSIERVVRSPERWDRIEALAASFGYDLPDDPDSRALAGFLATRRSADPDHFPDLSLTVIKLLGPGEYTVVRNGENEGHFGLAVQNYTHSTAPNRRFADLITQRLLKATFAKAPPPYTLDELTGIAARCTERENAARKVERLMRKVAAALWLQDQIGEVFEAIVTGASPKGTYARVTTTPIEGRIVRGEKGLDIGDRVRVRLIATDPQQGFIDFARA